MGRRDIELLAEASLTCQGRWIRKFALQDKGCPLGSLQVGIRGICCIAEVEPEVAVIQQLPNNPLILLSAHALAYLGIFWHLASSPLVNELNLAYPFITTHVPLLWIEQAHAHHHDLRHTSAFWPGMRCKDRLVARMDQACRVCLSCTGIVFT